MEKKLLHLLVFVAGVITFLVGCQTSLSPFSGRALSGLDKVGSTNGELAARPASPEPRRPKQIYFKETTPAIKKADPSLLSGSLADIGGNGSQIFSDDPSRLVGTYLDMKVVVQTTSEDKALKKDEEKVTAPENLEAEEKELFDALPELAPSLKKKRLPKMLKMKVTGQNPNGDLFIRYKRGSYAADDTDYAEVEATLPYRVYISGKSLELSDLVDIKFVHTKNGDIFEQESYAWEDDYTMRIAGFNESSSRSAIELEQKRTELQGIRNRLQTRLVTIGQERGNLAKTRTEVEKAKVESGKEVKELKEKMVEKDATIASQREELETIRKDETPGERRDGSDGE